MRFKTRALTKEPISFIFYMYPSPGEYAITLGFGLWTPLCVGARNDLSIFRKCTTISGQPRNTLAQSLWLARSTPFFVFPPFPLQHDLRYKTHFRGYMWRRFLPTAGSYALENC